MPKLTEDNIADLLAKAGVDVDVAMQDLQAHQKSIDDLLARNEAQAEAFGFQGTPGFIVGTFRVPGVVEMKVFKQIVADARAAAKKRKVLSSLIRFEAAAKRMGSSASCRSAI